MSVLSLQASRAFPPSPLLLRFGRRSPAGDGSVQWLLRRNCSVTPRQMLLAYAALSAVSLVIGAAFWLRGAPYVLPFTALELLAVGAALLAFARHAADSEKVVLRTGSLSVACVLGHRVESAEFTPAWVRIEPRHGDRSLIELSGEGRRIAIGRFVRPELRRALADELRTALRRPGVVALSPQDPDL